MLCIKLLTEVYILLCICTLSHTVSLAIEYIELFLKLIYFIYFYSVSNSCGNKRCPRNRANECFEMLNKDYKFYLAFENSNCRDYITEKFYVNGLGYEFIY